MGGKEQKSTTTSSTIDDVAEVGKQHGELYSPDYAIKIKVNNNQQQGKEKEEEEEKMAVVGAAAENIRRNLGMIKEKVMEKLAAAAVPAEAMENARQFLEGVVRDVGVAAHGLTKDALIRIKTHLVDLIPSLSPTITKKMVDDAEKEAAVSSGGNEEMEKKKENKADDQSKHDTKAQFMLPTSSLFSTLVKPISSRL